MRVVVACLPVPNHWRPVMPLAEALRAAGHDVLVATGAGAAERLEASGWDVARVGAAPDAASGQLMRSNPELRTLPVEQRWRFGLALFTGSLADQVVEELGAVLAARPTDLVVYEEMNVGAAVAAGLAGVPAVRHSVGPGVVPPMQEGFIAQLSQRWQQAGRTAPPARELFGRLAVDVWPAALRQPGVAPAPLPVAPMRLLPWDDGSGSVPGWLRGPRARPVVHVALASAPHMGAGVLGGVLEALAGLDVEVLVDVSTVADPAVLGPVGERVHLQGSLPLAELGLVDLVVHPGGAVTTLGAAEAGVPQMVLPQRVQDEFFNAAAVAGAGAGLALVPERQTVDEVRTGVGRLLEDPSYREGTRQLGKELATMPSPRDVVARLENLVA